MEKKNKSRSNGSSAPSSIRKTKLLVKEEEDASCLIGSIVEKGIKENNSLHNFLAPPSVPNPTVLPFPVARHRSHPPYGFPLETKKPDSDEEANDKEDNASEHFKSFANPVQKKEKKGVNISRWRELLPTDDIPMTDKKDNGKLMKFEHHKKHGERTDLRSASPGMEVDSHFDPHQFISKTTKGVENNRTAAVQESVDKMDTDYMDDSCSGTVTSADSVLNGQPVSQRLIGFAENQNLGSSKMKETPRDILGSAVASHSGGHQSISLESEIDSENCARLERMTAAEIAEAQSEILEKMKPGIVEALKKRAHNKLKKQNSSSSDLLTNTKQESLHGKDQDTNMPTAPERESPRKSRLNKKQKVGPETSSLWEAWSERVETVRSVRFSLEGDVIEDNSAHKSGQNPNLSGYSVENVAERDILRTDGDPGAAGYTIKEALELTRSVVPAQRAVALHLLASVLYNALQNICCGVVGNIDNFIDWEAIWAFALGPEPELVLSLRMSLDDNHRSVVLACARVIECLLSCDENESFFQMSEKTGIYHKDVYTAPIFRSKPDINGGFLHGGFWKYNAKPSNILPSEDFSCEVTEEERTIRDDVALSGQDVAAGLVRMEILPRICYILETDCTVPLEESLIAILIAIARHSPVNASAIMKCPGLIQTVTNGFIMKSGKKIRPSEIRSVTLLRVLAQSDRKNCTVFLEKGIIRRMAWQLYQYKSSVDQWIRSDQCELASALMVEQLRLWRVCVHYGYCVSDFENVFPALCMWLHPPSFKMLIENGVFSDVSCISTESYLVLEALARRLPKLYSQTNSNNGATEVHSDGTAESWHWRYVGPVVDMALKWLPIINDPDMKKFFDKKESRTADSIFQEISLNPLIWVISAVMHMLSTVLERVIPAGHGVVPWLPEFVPKIGLEIIKNDYLSFSDSKMTEGGSFLGKLCHLRHQSDIHTSLSSICCLQGLIHVVLSVDKLIQSAKLETHTSSEICSFGEGDILEDGIVKCSISELRNLQVTLVKLIDVGWQEVQWIEKFGRGGLAPGVGVGWGATGGGFWSEKMLLVQADARLLIDLFRISVSWPVKDPDPLKEMTSSLQMINSLLEICSTMGPRDGDILEVVITLLLEIPTLKCLNYFVSLFIDINGLNKSFCWEYGEDELYMFSKALASHFRSRWLCSKKKSKGMDSKGSGATNSRHTSGSLDTIFEDPESLSTTNEHDSPRSLVVEWAYQRLPLPIHWFLSPISTANVGKHNDLPNASNKPNSVLDPKKFLEAAKSGLFFLWGLEAMTPFLPAVQQSPVQQVPLVRKLHSLSVVLLDGMAVLEDEKSRDVYAILQELYGRQLQKSSSCSVEANGEKNQTMVENKHNAESLRFQAEIHESYPTFIETLVEQFAALSYGDLVFGRQIAIYLHRHVEPDVRLAAWNTLSSLSALELLPPPEKCLAGLDGYLEPVEDNERILEAYMKSWISGTLDRAAMRRSLTFILALHHLSCFIFRRCTDDTLLLRNKLAKSLLRDYSHKSQHEGIMLELVRYGSNPFTSKIVEEDGDSTSQAIRIEDRLKVLVGACQGNSSLLIEVDKLKAALL